MLDGKVPKPDVCGPSGNEEDGKPQHGNNAGGRGEEEVVIIGDLVGSNTGDGQACFVAVFVVGTGGVVVFAPFFRP